MSKSYDNTIPLFGSAQQLKAAIARIVTDSRLPSEPKDPDTAHLFTLYRAFASPEQSAVFAAELRQGLGWGEAKQQLFELLEQELAPAREHYQSLMAKPAELEDILQAGAAKARKIATPFLGQLREAVGLRRFQAQVQVAKPAKKKLGKGARFASFRESDGSFRFRFFAADGEQLLLSRPFADPKAAGATSQRLIAQAASLDMRPSEPGQFSLWLDGEGVADSAVFTDDQSLNAAMQRLREALASLVE